MRNKIKIFSVAVLFALFFMLSTASAESTNAAPSIEWQKSLGGLCHDNPYVPSHDIHDSSLSIQQTTEGDYIASWLSYDLGTIFSPAKTSYVVKISSDGKTYSQYPLIYGPGILDISIASVCQLKDGSYVAASSVLHDDYKSSWGLSKFGQDGSVIGSVSNPLNALIHNVQPTSDGGCIVAGTVAYPSEYWDGERYEWVPIAIGGGTIVKFDQNLNEMWIKSFDVDNSATWCARQTSDGGYVTIVNYNNDCWVYKLNANGDTVWKQKYGGATVDSVVSINQTSDDGYILAGSTTSYDIPGYHKDNDVWVVKLDKSGTMEWQKAFGGNRSDTAYSAQQTSDGGYFVAGYTESDDGDVTVNYGNADNKADGWLLKLDANGNLLWEKSIGGIGNDYIHSGQQTSDGGYIVSGYSNTHLTTYDGNYDAWIVKLAPDAIPIVPNFTATPTSGFVPLNVSFTDLSTGTPTSWIWDFGDGNTSTTQNPSNIYSTAGTYVVNFTAINDNGENSTTRIITVNAIPPIPIADFSATPTSGDTPLNVSFTDTSIGTPTGWNWSFGDGKTSKTQNPSHIYQSAGIYTVSLTAKNKNGTNTTTKTNFITVTDPSLVADFSATPTSGTTPLSVGFTDTSIGTPTGWTWSFGDGKTSKAQNPTNTYKTAGTYTVSLTVKDKFGPNTTTKTNFITVTDPLLVADFSATPTSGTAPLNVSFADASIVTPTGWTWSFGDGKTSKAQNPSHIYKTAGTYTVSLKAKDKFGTNTATKNGYIIVS